MRSRLRRRARREASDVDVTAFLSLIVILVPFLLITAVFSRITILELEGLSSTAARDANDSPVGLQVVVRESVIEVKYGQDETLSIERTANGTELDSLASRVDELKTRHPQSLNATILLEPQVPYDLLVQVMDIVRLRRDRPVSQTEGRELFPSIALGSVAVVDTGLRKPQ